MAGVRQMTIPAARRAKHQPDAARVAGRDRATNHLAADRDRFATDRTKISGPSGGLSVHTGDDYTVRSNSSMPMPEEIVGLLRSKITIKWPGGHVTTYPARDLRLACRCAGCIEETSGRPLLDPKVVPDNIRANSMELLGQYAIGVTWSD